MQPIHALHPSRQCVNTVLVHIQPDQSGVPMWQGLACKQARHALCELCRTASSKFYQLVDTVLTNQHHACIDVTKQVHIGAVLLVWLLATQGLAWQMLQLVLKPNTSLDANIDRSQASVCTGSFTCCSTQAGLVGTCSNGTLLYLCKLAVDAADSHAQSSMPAWLIPLGPQPASEMT